MNLEKRAFTKEQNEVIQFVMAAHWTQRRKSTVLPYVVHPIEVASYLGRFYPENRPLILAGYLHDTLEDTETSPDAIKNRFGEDVLNLVLGVTAEKKNSWKETRRAQIDNLKSAPIDVVRLKAADMLSNASSISLDVQFIHGVEAFNKFKASKEDVQWYYENSFNAILNRLSLENTGDFEPIVAALEIKLDGFIYV